MKTLKQKKEQLNNLLLQGNTPAIAYSGGIDSSLLLYLAAKLRNGDALGILVETGCQRKKEIEKALTFAREHHLKIVVVSTNILSLPQVKNNSRQRCYFCKKKMLQIIKKTAAENDCTEIYDGSITDDSKEYRPGLTALKEEKIKSPLLLCGFTKTNVRQYAKELTLPIWQKPASPCLLTRFPYDMKRNITEKDIKKIDEGEAILKLICQDDFRLRWNGENSARIEATAHDMQNIMERREELLQALALRGFNNVALDLRPFSSGSFDREKENNQ